MSEQTKNKLEIPDLTARDYMAIYFAAGALSNPDIDFDNNWEAARAAYRLADAMLEVREE